MDRIAVFVGLDYHPSGVQVCVMDGAGRVLGNRKCPNEADAVIAYAARFGVVRGIAVEACSGAADFADDLMQRAGWSVDLAHPGYVARMKQNPDKSDYSDGRMLADLVRVGFRPRVWLAPREVRELRLLVRYRQQLVEERRAAKLRIGAVLREQRCLDAPPSRWSRPIAWPTTTAGSPTAKGATWTAPSPISTTSSTATRSWPDRT